MREQYLKELEKRYGKIEKNVIEKFGKNYFNGIKGWQFSEEKVKKANENGKLLTMDLDFPGNRCKLDCIYCFAKVGEKTGTYYRPGEGDKPLTISEIKKNLIKAKSMGLESVKIIGYREPFDNPGFYEFLDFLGEQKIYGVIFTAGYTLGEKKFRGNLSGAINFLAERPISLMIKLHTLNKKKEDKIVNSKGFSNKRDKILKALIDDGRFTNCNPTLLGIENVISSQNMDELLTSYEYFKFYKNVFVDLDPPIPVGRTGTLEEAEKAGLLPQNKLKELCIKTYKINKKQGVEIKGISPYFGGDRCTQLTNGLYLTLSGKVMTCCGGDEEIGDIKKKSLEEIFDNNPYRKKDQIFHNCPYREKKNIMNEKFIKEVNEKLTN